MYWTCIAPTVRLENDSSADTNIIFFCFFFKSRLENDSSADTKILRFMAGP
jgi:hypothetical protein